MADDLLLLRTGDYLLLRGTDRLILRSTAPAASAPKLTLLGVGSISWLALLLRWVVCLLACTITTVI